MGRGDSVIVRTAAAMAIAAACCRLVGRETELSGSSWVRIASRHAGHDFTREVLETPSGWANESSSLRDAQVVEAARRSILEEDGYLRDSGQDDPVVLERIERALLDVAWTGGAARAEAYHVLALVRYRRGDIRGATAAAARSVILRPFASSSASNLAFFLQVSSRYAEARTLYLRARRLDRSNTAAHIGLLSLAPHLESLRVGELRSIAAEWRMYERDVALRPAAEAIVEALESLSGEPNVPGPAASTGAAVTDESASGDLDEVRRALRAVLVNLGP